VGFIKLYRNQWDDIMDKISGHMIFKKAGAGRMGRTDTGIFSSLKS
jgi:hypothetical protein